MQHFERIEATDRRAPARESADLRALRAGTAPAILRIIMTTYKVRFLGRSGRRYFAQKGASFTSAFEALACAYTLPGRPIFFIVVETA